MPRTAANTRRILRAMIPHQVRRAARFAVAASLDVADSVRGARDPRVPLRCRTFVGNGDFRAVGQAILELLIAQGGLKPTDAVLDVGAGQGRLALVLANYLAPGATYDGLEVVHEGVEWCRKVYANDPRFRFHHADIYNEHYNPKGRQTADRYEFPYADRAFDFAVLSSVFTHLRAPSVERYIEELARVVRTGGRVGATMFLLDSESRRLIKAGAANRLFVHEIGPAAVVYPDDPDAAVAQDEVWVIKTFNEAGFDVTVHHGKWSGRADGDGSQDFVMAVRH